MIKSPRFPVRRVTTTSFAVAILALSGCSVGLQAEGSSEFEQVDVASLEGVIAAAIERQADAGTSFADAVSGPSHDIDVSSPDLSVEQEEAAEADVPNEEQAQTEPEQAEQEPAFPEEDPHAEEPADEPVADEPESEEPVAAEEPIEEEWQEAGDEGDEVDSHEEEAESQAPASRWASFSYAQEDSTVGSMFGDVRMDPDGSAHGFGWAGFGDSSAELEVDGAWEASDSGYVVSMFGTAVSDAGEEISMEGRGLGLSDSCPYIQGGSMTVTTDSGRATLEFMEGCSPCFVLSIGSETLGKVCAD